MQNVNESKPEKKEDLKFSLFEKTQSKNGNVMKSQLPWNEKIDDTK